MENVIHNSQFKNSPKTIKEIQAWLINSVAEISDVEPQEININIGFESYGMDSSSLVDLTGDLQDWLTRNLDPTFFFDYPTIESASEYLVNEEAIAYAKEVFENDETAQKWLKRPNRALGGKIPYDLLDTEEGREQVYKLLGRIEYGVYS
jgi:acyl carrier protein